ncbi:outer membrane protein [Roseivivax lentus]|uniref:Outer membrane protein n=1 Tax=Roseivivax lentus TaxID=633194 RepID=A0A1N7PJ09_9RHOB|nr:TolC family outer membrane protein [Roseivivax lentus]SIT10572.1 outer membrane protein [Roseivivax lentus]
MALRQIILAAGLGLAATFAGGHVARADTLADALVGAYNSSGLLEQNRAVLRAADEDVAQAVAALRPVLDWTADVTRQFGESRSASSFGDRVGTVSESASIGLQASLLVFDFGRTRLSIDAAKQAVLATRYQLIGIEQEILFRGAQAFFELQRAQRVLAVRQNNLTVIGRELRAARDRFEVGEVTRTDVALAEARLAEARSQLAVAQGDVARAEQEYITATGRRPGGSSALGTVPAIPPSVEAATAIALKTQPDLIAAQYAVTLADLGVKIAEASLKPTVNLTGRYSLTQDLDDRDFYNRGGSISLGASGPIYRGGALTSALRQSVAIRDQRRAQLLVVSDNVRQSVANAYVNVQVARSAIQASRQQVEAAQVAFNGIREEAQLGARTTLDVLNAEQDLLDARTLLISAQVDEYVAAYNVIAATGRLTASALNLPVQQYDPTVYYNLVKDAPALSSQGEQLNRVLRAIGKD